MIGVKWVLAVGVVALTVGACSSTGPAERRAAARQDVDAHDRAELAAWTECARQLVSRAKDGARSRLQRDASMNPLEVITLDERERFMARARDAAYLTVESGCGMAPFYGPRMRQAVRRLWEEV